LPITEDEWDDVLHTPLDRLIGALEIQDQLDVQDRAVVEQIFVTIVDIEQSISDLGVTWIMVVVERRTVTILIRLVALLVVSLCLSLAFGTRYLPGDLPDLNTPVCVGVLSWLALSMWSLLNS
jgi:hypothetical protein